MAQIIPQTAVTYRRSYMEYLHRCGEVLNAIVQGNSIIGYADISKVKISVCPHCLKDIEYDDLQIPSNVDNYGWPS